MPMHQSKEMLRRFNTFRTLCQQNAQDNLRGANHCADQGIHHIAYHLAVLAVEEIGKIFMTILRLNRGLSWEMAAEKIAGEDHERKLFFAIWGPSIGTTVITKEQIDEHHHLASALHDKRLKTLYGDLRDTIPSIQKISEEEVRGTIRFAAACVELAGQGGEVNELATPSEEWTWFSAFSENPEHGPKIFGRQAQEKLIEQGEVSAWIRWLKEKHESEKKENHMLTMAEINRVVPADDQEFQKKWEIAFTVTTPTHTIRASSISKIRQLSRAFHIHAGKDERTLGIKAIFPLQIHIRDLWSTGWLSCKFFVAALNIGSHGFFYWNVPADKERFHDSIHDVQAKKRVDARLLPKQGMNWPQQKEVFAEGHLRNTYFVLNYIVEVNEVEKLRPIHSYLTGLAMLAKSDIHLPLENSAFSYFYEAFTGALKAHEKIGETDNLGEIGYDHIHGIAGGKEIYDRIMKLAESIDAAVQAPPPVSLPDVLAMKRYAEQYFLTLAARSFRKDSTLRIAPEEK